MTKFSNKLKKPCFWPILGPFSQCLEQKKNVQENSVLSRTTSYGFLAPCQNSEKVNDMIQRKRPDRRKDGWKDGQTLFYRTLAATAGGPIIWSCNNVYRKTQIYIFMINCCALFSLLIAANSKPLLVYHLFVCQYAIYYDSFNGEVVFYSSFELQIT